MISLNMTWSQTCSTVFALLPPFHGESLDMCLRTHIQVLWHRRAHAWPFVCAADSVGGGCCRVLVLTDSEW
jgi:hypothetical protein